MSQQMPRLMLDADFDEVCEWEMEQKGYVYVVLEYEQGHRYSIEFITPVRLAQNVEGDLEHRPCYYAPNLVVIPEVTRASAYLDRINGPLLLAISSRQIGRASCAKSRSRQKKCQRPTLCSARTRMRVDFLHGLKPVATFLGSGPKGSGNRGALGHAAAWGRSLIHFDH
jgi:hypothetical protein